MKDREDIFERLTNKVGNSISRNDLIRRGDHVILGLSGGPDSLCLLEILKVLQENMDFELLCAHLNHAYRGEAADADQRFVEEICRRSGLRCFSKKLKAAMKSEEEGRRARYDFFGEVADSIGGECSRLKVAVAQNRDDQVETIFHRIIRGSGTAGLGGMEYSREDERGYSVIRPLLDVDRRSIELCCEQRELNPCMDATNEEAIFLRNKIRLEALPYLRENFNENIEEALLRLAANAREDDMLLRSQAEAVLNDAVNDWDDDFIKLSLYRIDALEDPLLSRIIVKVLREIGCTSTISRDRIFGARQAVRQGQTSKQIQFPNGYRMYISYGEVIFEKNGKDEPSEVETEEISIREIAIEEWRKEFPAGLNEEAACFDAEKLNIKPGSLSIRNRLPGDYIALGGNGGHKKLQDFMVDRKIPQKIRDRIPIVFFGREAIWIKSKDGWNFFSPAYRIDENTKIVTIIETTA